MKHIFIDSNIFLRFLVKDNLKMAQEARGLFELMEKGKIRGETDIIILTEIVWTLGSFFKIGKNDIVEYISLLLNFKNLVIKDKEIIERALDIFRSNNIDFIDAFCGGLLLKRKIKYICSYDKDFDKIDGILRIEPRDLF